MIHVDIQVPYIPYLHSLFFFKLENLFSISLSTTHLLRTKKLITETNTSIVLVPIHTPIPPSIHPSYQPHADADVKSVIHHVMLYHLLACMHASLRKTDRSLSRYKPRK